MAERARISKLIGMLGSDFDGERANAAGMLKKAAAAEKKTIEELLISVYASGIPTIVYKERTVYKERPTAEPFAASAKDYAERYSDAGTSTKTSSRLQKLKRCEGLASVFTLTDWERQFIKDMIRRLEDGYEPSAKQISAMNQLFRKVGI